MIEAEPHTCTNPDCGAKTDAEHVPFFRDRMAIADTLVSIGGPWKDRPGGPILLDRSVDRETVLCIVPENVTPFVTWKMGPDGNVFWGHYFYTLREAVLDFEDRSAVPVDGHDRVFYLTGQVRKQREWIEHHGATQQGYVERYGSFRDTVHYGDGGEAIYAADLEELAQRELRLAAQERELAKSLAKVHS